MCSLKSKTMVTIIGVSCLVFLATGSECSSGVIECVGHKDSVFLQFKSPNRPRMVSTEGGALLQVKFEKYSAAVLVFPVSSTHRHRSSEIEELPAVMLEVLDQHNLYVCSREVS